MFVSTDVVSIRTRSPFSTPKFAQEGAGFEETMEFYNSGNALYVTYTVP
jgi:hypothetical protein